MQSKKAFNELRIRRERDVVQHTHLKFLDNTFL